MEGTTPIPRDEAAERQLIDRIRELETVQRDTQKQLVDVRVELEIRQRVATGDVPEWLNPKYVRRQSIAQSVVYSLDRNLMTGLNFSQLEQELRRAGRAVHKPSLTAVLGKLKREGKVARHRGRWKTVCLANGTYEPEEVLLEREYEREDW